MKPVLTEIQGRLFDDMMRGARIKRITVHFSQTKHVDIPESNKPPALPESQMLAHAVLGKVVRRPPKRQTADKLFCSCSKRSRPLTALLGPASIAA
jgi:hypothetical protein